MDNVEENEDVEGNPLLVVFKPPEATIFIHSEKKEVLAFLVTALQRIVGRENFDAFQPYFNDKRKTWGIQVFIRKLPRELLRSFQRDSKEEI
jgi:hypothetical protein